ncbi:hypothetical protein ACPDHL_00735 [Myroides sp. C15-4]|uniref:tetratricopeptide repeat protein n=1 Tax=Myroides sp. C15-4 TaxID=3400532 RepID=UPI003D2F6467
MTINTLHTYLADPSQIKRSDIQELKQLLEQYPYVQAVRSLYLKALYSNESTSYNQELKKTAAYTLDRDMLFNFIVSDDFTAYRPLALEEVEKEVEEIQPESVVIATKDREPEQNISSLLESISKVAYAITKEDRVPFEERHKQEDAIQPAVEPSAETSIETALNTTDTSVFTAATSSEVIADHVQEEQNDQVRRENTLADSPTEILENKLEIGKPLAFEADEKYSFQEWLQLSKQQPILRESNTKSDDSPQEEEQKKEIITKDEKKFQESLEKKQAMIDKFIETNPKIIPTKKATASPINIELSVQENTSLMTETLAKIYLEQKKYQKAIQAYEILILKYPEKSSFFANQILDIKALQQHNSL